MFNHQKMKSCTDADIKITLLKDKSKGIHLLFEHYYHPLVVYAGNFLENEHAAEDVVQEFFVRLWEDDHLKKVPDTGLAAYLYTAVRNSCFTLYSQKDILRHTEELTMVEVPVEVFFSVEDERINRVMQEIERLPERSRQVVECVMLRGLKYKEAAEEMNVSVNTVKFLLKEATKRLRNNLSDSFHQILFFIFRKIF